MLGSQAGTTEVSRPDAATVDEPRTDVTAGTGGEAPAADGTPHAGTAHAGADVDDRLGRRLAVARTAAIALACSTGAVLAAYPLARAFARWRRRSDPDFGDDIPLTFDVNTEATIPTWYNAGLLLAVAVLCAVFSALRRAAAMHAGWRWLVLAAVFALMSVDETVSLHEKVGPRAAEVLELEGGGLLHHAWVVAGVGLALAFAAVAGWALVTLPRRLRRWMIAGLGVYVSGALGAEAVSGAVHDSYGDGVAYLAVTLVEEGAEMAGAVIVLCALLAAIEVRVARSGDVRVRLAPALAGP